MIEIPDWLKYMADDSRAQAGDVAELFGIPETTLGYQHRNGLFPKPERWKMETFKTRGKPSWRIGWSKAVLLEEIAKRNNA